MSSVFHDPAIAQASLFASAAVGGVCAGRGAAAPQAAQNAATGGLGILTKYADPVLGPISTVSADGEVKVFQPHVGRDGVVQHTEQFNFDAALLERWQMKQHARKLLMRIEKRDKRVKVLYSKLVPAPDPSLCDRLIFAGVGFKLEQAFTVDGEVMQKNAARFRVINCGRDKISVAREVEIWKSRENDVCAFHQVQVCGSVWTCPTCSAKINRARQLQIEQCYNLFAEQSESDCLMITFTIKHGFSDRLSETFDRLKQAFRRLQKSFIYKCISGFSKTKTSGGKKSLIKYDSQLRYVGRISATELTHGANGWHPHLHQLWFFDRKLSKREIESLRAQLFVAWESACVAVGLAAPLEFFNGKPLGVDVRRALSAAAYLTKFGVERRWGVEKELAGSHKKKARKSGRTPFQLLFDSMSGDARAGQLFVEFAEATLGKHQLEFTPGLRERLNKLVAGIETSDSELSASLADNSDLLGCLSDNEFFALSRASAAVVEPFSTFLMLCARSGIDAGRRFIHSLPFYAPPIVQTDQYENLHLRHLRAKYG